MTDKNLKKMGRTWQKRPENKGTNKEKIAKNPKNYLMKKPS